MSEGRLAPMNSNAARGLHGQVVQELGQRVLQGTLPSGSLLDPEGLATEFAVSRTVIREALKVLAAKGLIGARPRFGTYVTERSSWQLLDPSVMAWRASAEPDPRLLMELSELRLVFEPAGARLAAARRSETQLARIRTAFQELERSYRAIDSDRPDHAAADLEFHRAVLAAAGNELLEQFEVLLAPALQARDRLAHQFVTTFEFLDGHKQVLDAIADADPERAEFVTRALMEAAAIESAQALARSLPGPTYH